MNAAFRCLVLVVLSAVQLSAAALPEFDFSDRAQASAWGEAHHASLASSDAGLAIRITGPDPYFSGPSRDYPPAENLWLHIALSSDSAGMAQIFFFKTGATEENSIRFFVPAGDSQDVRVPLPPLGPGTRLRFDPPGTNGVCLLRRITFTPRPQLTQPKWKAAVPLALENSASRLQSGPLTLLHSPNQFGTFELRVHNASTALGHSALPVGYSLGTNLVWLSLTNRATVSRSDSSLKSELTLTDPDGARWTFVQVFIPNSGALDVESTVSVSQDRDVIFLPMLLLFPGVDSFGTNKSQALFAGLEYLENEPSSSEADVIGPGSLRRVPDSLKVTFPLMSVAAGNRYLALTWEQRPNLSAIFDSPDRVFSSPGHLMGVIFPGSTPDVRADGQVLPYGGVTIKAGETIRLRATLLGGSGNTIIPALQEYVKRRALPEPPSPGYSQSEFFELAARGWADSEIRDGAQFRHAVGPNFGSQPAADATLFIEWLSLHVPQSFSSRLHKLATEALAQVAPDHYNSAAVGHIRSPAPALAFGNVLANAHNAASEARALVRQFEIDGGLRYKPRSRETDLGKTHWSREANGLAATTVATILERAAFSGDPDLIKDGLRLLRALGRFNDTVPRGAQTWEVPLHTPDILASAYLVRAFTLGYELTGEREFLEQARYWAWTGIPFLYLTAPVAKPVALYSTIPVLGATQWVAPLWIGLPVQWCGLVYGHAIRRLARYDDSAPWRQIADGIAFSGIQQTHPLSDRGYEGLLPDSFELRHQVRNPVPINPGTLLADALEAYRERPVYDRQSFPAAQAIVHAAGPITNSREIGTSLAFHVTPWRPSWVLVTGLKKLPAIRIGGAPLERSAIEFEDSTGLLTFTVERECDVEVSYER